MRAFEWLIVGICATGLAHADDRRFDKKVTAEPRGTVEISNVSGSIKVSGWDSPEVEVQGDMGAGVDRIDVESDHGRTTIKVIVPNHSFRSISTDLRIRVPRESELDISGVSADVYSTDVQGALQLKTVSGNVRADIFLGGAEVKTVSGDVELHGKAQGPGANSPSIHLSTISGNVTVQHGNGDFEGTTISGAMNVQLDSTRTVRVRTTSGDLNFQGKVARGGAIDGETVSGDLNIHALPETGLDYEIATFSGDINNCMGVQAANTNKFGPGKRLTGSVGTTGSDGVRVRLKTMSGSVDLCNRS